MRVSPKKRAANRRNALQSTGPKTDSGRRSSSQNATRHGLSVPLPEHLLNPLQSELTQLITPDGILFDTAQDLAQKIIDYERNLLYLREIFDKEVTETLGRNKEGDVGSIVPNERKAKTEEVLLSVESTKTRGMDQAEREDRTLLIQMCKFILKVEKGARARSEREKVNSLRYFKRSSNQLINALRRL